MCPRARFAILLSFFPTPDEEAVAMDQAVTIEQVETIDEARIGFTRRGGGEPVLLVHGTISNAESWALVAPHLASEFTVVTMDRRGRGASSDGTAPYSLEVDARDVAAVIDALGEPVHLVGHSFGAVVALVAAARGAPLRSLVLYEPMLAPRHLPEPLERVADRVEELLRAGDRPAAVEFWLRNPATVGLFGSEEVDALTSDPAVWARFVGAVHTIPREVGAGIRPWDFRDAIRRIEVPVLNLVGEHTTTPAVLEGLDDLERLLPQARRVVLPDQGHLANAFAPEALAEGIAAFIRRLEPAPAPAAPVPPPVPAAEREPDTAPVSYSEPESDTMPVPDIKPEFDTEPVPHPASVPRMPVPMQAHVTGNGPRIVLVGGGLTGWKSWVPHAERLAPSRTVARLQLLSVQWGLQDRALPDGYGVRMESEALAAALDGLEWSEPVDLVAWSYGGLVSLDFALNRPERVRTLTLIEPPAVWLLPGRGRGDPDVRALLELQIARDRDVSDHDLERFIRAVGLAPPGMSPRQLPQWPDWMEHRRSLRNVTDAFAHVDDPARLRALGLPVLLVTGTDTAPFLRRVHERLDLELPDARALEMPGGHAPHLVSMDRFLEALATFQGRVP
jgi:pimeloyl-ACP methyl ester carboxylesterase